MSIFWHFPLLLPPPYPPQPTGQRVWMGESIRGRGRGDVHSFGTCETFRILRSGSGWARTLLSPPLRVSYGTKTTGWWLPALCSQPRARAAAGEQPLCPTASVLLTVICFTEPQNRCIMTVPQLPTGKLSSSPAIP